MGLFNKLVCFTLFLVIGISTTSGQACQNNQTKIAELNATVDGFKTQLDLIMSSGLPAEQQNNMVFDIACFNATYRPLIDMIVADLATCPGLAVTTNLATLSFGPVTFTSIFTLFPTGGLPEFCNCSSYLTNALALQAMASMYTLDVTNGQYPMVGNLGFYCNQNMMMAPQAPPMNIMMMLNMTLMGLDMSCPRVYVLAGMANTMQAEKVRDYLSMCANFNETAFQCALGASQVAAFKTCVGEVTGDDDAKACATYECIDDNIANTCGNMAAMDFIKAVNIKMAADSMAALRENDDDCSASSIITVSLTSLIASLLVVFMNY